MVFIEEMKIIGIFTLYVLPGGTTTKEVVPAEMVFIGPTVILGMGVKPPMSDTGVIEDKIDDNFDWFRACVGYIDEFFEFCQVAKARFDLAVANDVVAVVMPGRFENRAQPNYIGAEVFGPSEMLGSSRDGRFLVKAGRNAYFV